MRLQAILFDLDGTLLNTLADLTDSCNLAMRAMGWPEHTQAEVRGYINNGVRHLVVGASPKDADNAALDRCEATFRAAYQDNLANKTAPYDGILDMLRELRALGYRMAVVSNKFDSAVKMLSAKYFGDLIDVAIGESEALGIRRKPAPDSAFAALAALDAPIERALYVGDSNVDIETARNAGLPCLSVSWGFRSKESLTLAGAEKIIDTPAALIPALAHFEEARA